MSARSERERTGDPGDTASAVADLAARFGLAPEAVIRLRALLAVLTQDRHAPTTLHEPRTAVRDHLADSLVALELPEVRDAARIADLGAGAGLPGLPLAIALPHSHVHLVESNGRKCAFIAAAAERCAPDNTTVVHARAEEWRAGLRSCDLVVARALAPLAVVAEYAAPLLRVGGVMLAWRGRRDPDDEAAGAAAAAQLGLAPRDPVRVTPYPGALHRHLHPMVKISDTPDRFPRRTGVARKRPLA